MSLLAFEPSVQSELRVEIREVWLIRGGSETQLTHDSLSKPQALLSPSQKRIAYFEQCPQPEHCTPTIVILDLEGHRLASLQPQLRVGPSTEPCSSILSISWNMDEAIAADCHISPSLGNYIETDIATGRTAVVSRNGKAALLPLIDVPPADLWGAKLRWIAPKQLSLKSEKVTRTIDVP